MCAWCFWVSSPVLPASSAAGSGVLVYARAQGGLPWTLVLALAAGFATGALLGARLAARTGAARLTRAFSVFVATVAAALLWRALGAG